MIHHLKKYVQIIQNGIKLKLFQKLCYHQKYVLRSSKTSSLHYPIFMEAGFCVKFKLKNVKLHFFEKLVECLTNREKHLMQNKVLFAAIFLDPRYKITLDDQQYTTATSHLIGVWLQLKKLEQKSVDLTINNDDIILSEDSDDDSTVGSDGLEEFLKEKDNIDKCIVSKMSQTSISHTIKAILKLYYIKQDRLNHKINILKFWKSLETVYPEIYILSKIILSVPSTQVSVERLFSGLKFILSPFRSNINSQNLDDQLLVRTNRLFNKVENEYNIKIR